MLIYEVNLEVQQDIRSAYVSWLQEHIQDMLQFNGFERAQAWENDDLENNASQTSCQIVIHYYIRTEQDLQYYFEKHAATMREQGLTRFKGKFSAHRRVLKAL